MRITTKLPGLWRVCARKAARRAEDRQRSEPTLPIDTRGVPLIPVPLRDSP